MSATVWTNYGTDNSIMAEQFARMVVMEDELCCRWKVVGWLKNGVKQFVESFDDVMAAMAAYPHAELVK